MRSTEKGTSSNIQADVPDLMNLRSILQGQLVLPGDPGYDEARRVFNDMIDRRPAAIARCITTDDVVACIDTARTSGIPVTVRGGGHGVAGHSVNDGALMIDLSLMKGITVDVDRGIAHVEPGVRLGEMIEATERYGMVTPTGTASDTGVAGLTLGGGMGWIGGKFGLAVDNLVGAEVVLASGETVHASADEHPDLYWALRGGSGNFGVVTRFDLRLHPLRQVTGGMLIHPFERAREVLQFYREVASSAPDELIVFAVLLTAPDGNKAIALIPCWCGEEEGAEGVLAPIRGFGPPLVDLVQTMPYSQMNQLIDQAAPPGRRNYWKQAFADQLEDDGIDTVIDLFDRVPSSHSAILIDMLHGATTRVAPDVTAFAHRNARFGFVMLSMWTDPAKDDENIKWTRELFDAMSPFTTGGIYVNESQDDRAQSVFGENYARLATIKARYDPTNLFRHFANIAPPSVPSTDRAAD
ncbi:MAG TPA: FAD-binding oxidoreductase [Thermomicrobiales bacterium]|nr:FAD-binding oxidoreductase [Thermomicrobiales bacterium]